MITIEIYNAVACITTQPSLLRRLFLRAKTTEQYAIKVELITGGQAWRWEDGSRIPGDILDAIHSAVRQQRRPMAQAIEPPSTS